ncbi:hypothetical protein Tco_1012093, partial [Tanacetum coccineum]
DTGYDIWNIKSSEASWDVQAHIRRIFLMDTAYSVSGH